MVGLSVDDDKKTIEIDTEQTQYDLSTIPVEEFPIADFENAQNSFCLDGTVFWELLNNVKGAISTEETRYYLNGVYLHQIADKLVAIATDGHRLYCQEVDLPEGAHNMPGAIVPRAVIANFMALTKATKNRPEQIKIRLSETKIEIYFDNVRIRSKLVDGTFPDYHRIIPAYPAQTARFDADDMTGAIKDVSLISSECGRAVKLAIKGGSMELTVNNPDSGTARATVADQSGNAEIEIGFNSKYLIDLLALVSGNTTDFAFTDSGSPALITCDIEGWKAVLMPMRL